MNQDGWLDMTQRAHEIRYELWGSCRLNLENKCVSCGDIAASINAIGAALAVATRLTDETEARGDIVSQVKPHLNMILLMLGVDHED